MITSRAIELQLPGDWPPSRVEADGAELAYSNRPCQQGWWFTGNTLTTTIRTIPFSTDAPLAIVVTRNPQWTAATDLLDGFAGKVETLRAAYDEINPTTPVEALVVAMQTGDRITYHPEATFEEVRRPPQLARDALGAARMTQSSLQLLLKPHAQLLTTAPSLKRKSWPSRSLQFKR